MKCMVIVALSCLLFGPMAVAEEEPVPVSVIQLIATPERFDGKLISVTGFLVMGERAFLCLHREDAEHMLASNSFSVIRTEEMRRNEEKLNGMYVRIVGVFHTVPAKGGWLISQINDIKQCYVVSDPTRPRDLYGKRRPGPKEK
jgi:hypothetical protein